MVIAFIVLIIMCFILNMNIKKEDIAIAIGMSMTLIVLSTPLIFFFDSAGAVVPTAIIAFGLYGAYDNYKEEKERKRMFDKDYMRDKAIRSAINKIRNRRMK